MKAARDQNAFHKRAGHLCDLFGLQVLGFKFGDGLGFILALSL